MRILSVRMNTATATFMVSAAEYRGCPEPTLPEFAFAGRSNVGKSSLLNFLVGKRDLAKVSATPGHTKHLNFFEIEDRWRLVDLPGYGYARVERKERGRFSVLVAEYLANRPNLECVFTLVDASLPPQELDLEFFEWLVDNEVPFVIVFTKTDRVSEQKLEELQGELQNQAQRMVRSAPGDVLNLRRGSQRTHGAHQTHRVRGGHQSKGPQDQVAAAPQYPLVSPRLAMPDLRCRQGGKPIDNFTAEYSG